MNRDHAVLGIKAFVLWALMVFVPLWLRSIPQAQMLYDDSTTAMVLDVLLIAWLFGVHALALVVYRKERAEWVRSGSAKG